MSLNLPQIKDEGWGWGGRGKGVVPFNLLQETHELERCMI